MQCKISERFLLKVLLVYFSTKIFKTAVFINVVCIALLIVYFNKKQFLIEVLFVVF